MIYTVQPGDNLWSIAARFGVSVQDLIAANQNIHPHMIYAGQTIVIPRAPHHAQTQTQNAEPLSDRVAKLEAALAQLEEIMDHHRRQIADLQRRVGSIEQKS